jgi:preprotein translocase subunit YajC
MLISVLPFVLIFVIMYFLIIRPQRQQLKKRGEMLAAVRRGDTVVTGGGLVGKVTKVVDDNELEVDLGNGVKVTALRSTIADVRVKGEPVANQNAKK